MTITEIKVHMNCVGCETKIRKAIQKLHGVDDIDIDREMQKVTVMGWAEPRKVLKAVRKTGRRAELWPYPYNPESYSFNLRQLETETFTNYANKPTSSYNPESYSFNLRQHETETFTYYANKPASSYNYNTHGYSEEEFGYYQKPAYAAIVDEEASAIFSDENPHACSVM